MPREIMKAQSGPYTAIVTIEDAEKAEEGTQGEGEPVPTNEQPQIILPQEQDVQPRRMSGGRYRRVDGTLLEKHTFYITKATHRALLFHALEHEESASESVERILRHVLKLDRKEPL